MKTLIIILALACGCTTTHAQIKKKELPRQQQSIIAKKWLIVQVEAMGKLQDVELKKGEEGPYIWLKTGGEAEVNFFAKGKGSWKLARETKTLIITEPGLESKFLVQELTAEKMILKPLDKTGEMDPTLFVLKPKPAAQ